MIKLYTENEFENAKINDKLKLECVVCHQPFLKLKRSIQSVIRGDKGVSGEYCSSKCISEMKKTGYYVKCELCGKEFYRCKGEMNVINFCSSSCSATYNNKKRIVSDETKDKIRKKLEKKYEKECLCCQKIFVTHKKDKIFCDKNCKKNYYLSSENIEPKRDRIKIVKKEKSNIENRGGYREKVVDVNNTNTSIFIMKK